MAQQPGRFRIEWFDYTRATKPDMDAILHVYKTVFTEDIGEPFDEKLDSDFLRPLDYYADNVRGAFLVVRDTVCGGRIVGTAALRNFPKLNNQAELKRMLFLKVCRGHGLAPKMAVMLIGKAMELKYDAIVLDTKTKLKAANAVYERLGWVDCEDYNGNPRPDRWMRRVLPRQPGAAKL